MKNIWIIAVVLGAFFLEISLGNNLALWAVRPPLVGAVLFFFFGARQLSFRLFLAVMGGALLDSVSWHPFGTHLVILFASAFFVEILQSFLSNIESPVTRGAGMTIEIFLFLNLIPLVGSVLGAFQGPSSYPTREIWNSVLLISIIWAVLLPLGLVVFVQFLSVLRGRIKAFASR